MTLLFADFAAPRRDCGRRLRRFVAARARNGPPRVPSACDRRPPDVHAAGRARRVLIPILDSAGASAAARYVARESLRGERSEAHLLYLAVARAPVSARRSALRGRAAERSIRPARELLRACRVPVAVHVRAGARAPAIVAAARELDVDRIVIGVSPERSLMRLIEDPIVERVADFAPVPVDVVVSNSLSRLDRIGVPLGLGVALGVLVFRVAD